MFGSLMLDVAIGMVLVFLLLSFVASAVREGIESVLRERSSFLRRGVCELLNDESLAAAMYSHPQVSALYRGDYATAIKKKELPAYIPSRNFALALLDIAVRGRDPHSASEASPGSATLSLPSVRQNVSRIGNPAVQRVVLSAIDLSGGDFAKAQASIEAWFDSSMDRVSGWYKHRTQRILIVIGIVVAAIANVDTIRVAHSFYNDPGQRQLAIAMASSLTKEPAPGTAGSPAVGQARADSLANEALRRIDALKLPVGWPDAAITREWYMRILGWLITAFAISFGAPFWFALLNRMMVARSTVKPQEKSPEESSEDRQTGGKDKPKMTSAPTVIVATGTAAAPTTVHSAAGAAIDPGADYQGHEWSSGFPEAGII